MEKRMSFRGGGATKPATSTKPGAGISLNGDQNAYDQAFPLEEKQNGIPASGSEEYERNFPNLNRWERAPIHIPTKDASENDEGSMDTVSEIGNVDESLSPLGGINIQDILANVSSEVIAELLNMSGLAESTSEMPDLNNYLVVVNIPAAVGATTQFSIVSLSYEETSSVYGISDDQTWLISDDQAASFGVDSRRVRLLRRPFLVQSKKKGKAEVLTASFASMAASFRETATDTTYGVQRIKAKGTATVHPTTLPTPAMSDRDLEPERSSYVVVHNLRVCDDVEIWSALVVSGHFGVDPGTDSEANKRNQAACTHAMANPIKFDTTFAFLVEVPPYLFHGAASGKIFKGKERVFQQLIEIPIDISKPGHEFRFSCHEGHPVIIQSLLYSWPCEEKYLAAIVYHLPTSLELRGGIISAIDGLLKARASSDLQSSQAGCFPLMRFCHDIILVTEQVPFDRFRSVDSDSKLDGKKATRMYWDKVEGSVQIPTSELTDYRAVKTHTVHTLRVYAPINQVAVIRETLRITRTMVSILQILGIHLLVVGTVGMFYRYPCLTFRQQVAPLVYKSRTIKANADVLQAAFMLVQANRAQPISRIVYCHNGDGTGFILVFFPDEVSSRVIQVPQTLQMFFTGQQGLNFRPYSLAPELLPGWRLSTLLANHLFNMPLLIMQNGRNGTQVEHNPYTRGILSGMSFLDKTPLLFFGAVIPVPDTVVHDDASEVSGPGGNHSTGGSTVQPAEGREGAGPADQSAAKAAQNAQRFATSAPAGVLGGASRNAGAVRDTGVGTSDGRGDLTNGESTGSQGPRAESGSQDTTSLTSSIDDCQSQVRALRQQLEEGLRLHELSRQVIESLGGRLSILEGRGGKRVSPIMSVQELAEQITTMQTDAAGVRVEVAAVAGRTRRLDLEADSAARRMQEVIQQVDATSFVQQDMQMRSSHTASRIDRLEFANLRVPVASSTRPSSPTLQRVEELLHATSDIRSDINEAKTAIAVLEQRTAQEFERRSEGDVQVSADEYPARVALLTQTVDRLLEWSGIADQPLSIAQQFNAVGVAGLATMAIGDEAAAAASLRADEAERATREAVQRVGQETLLCYDTLRAELQVERARVSGMEAAHARLFTILEAYQTLAERTAFRVGSSPPPAVYEGGEGIRINNGVPWGLGEVSLQLESMRLRICEIEDTLIQPSVVLMGETTAFQAVIDNNEKMIRRITTVSADVDRIAREAATLVNTTLLEVREERARAMAADEVNRNAFGAIEAQLRDTLGSNRSGALGSVAHTTESVRVDNADVLHSAPIKGGFSVPADWFQELAATMTVMRGEVGGANAASTEARRLALVASVDCDSMHTALTAMEEVNRRAFLVLEAQVRDVGNEAGHTVGSQLNADTMTRAHFKERFDYHSIETAGRMHSLTADVEAIRADVHTANENSTEAQRLVREVLEHQVYLRTEEGLERDRISALVTGNTSHQRSLGSQDFHVLSQGGVDSDLSDRVASVTLMVDRLVEWSGIIDQPTNLAQQFEVVGEAFHAARAYGDEAVGSATVRCEEARRAACEAVIKCDDIQVTVATEQAKLALATVTWMDANESIDAQLRELRERGPEPLSQSSAFPGSELLDQVSRLNHTVDQLVEWSGLPAQTNSYALQFEAVKLEFRDLHKAIIAARGAALTGTVISTPLQVLPAHAGQVVELRTESGPIGEVVHAQGVQINQNYSDIHYLTLEIQASMLAMQRFVDSTGEDLNARLDSVVASNSITQEVLGLVAEAASVDLEQLMTAVDANPFSPADATAAGFHTSSGFAYHFRHQQVQLPVQAVMDTDLGIEEGGRKRKLLSTSIPEVPVALLGAPPARVMRVEKTPEAAPIMDSLMEIGACPGGLVGDLADTNRGTELSERVGVTSSSTGVVAVISRQVSSAMIGPNTEPAFETSTEILVRGNDEDLVVGSTRRRSIGGRLVHPSGGLYNIPTGSHVVLLQMVAFQSADEMPQKATAWVRQQRRIEALQIVLPVGTKVFTLGACPSGMQHMVDESAHVHFKSGSRGRFSPGSDEQRKSLQGFFAAGMVGGIFLDYDVFTNDHLVTLGSVSNNGAGAGMEIFSQIAFLLLDGDPNAIAVIPNPATYFLDALRSPGVRGMMLKHQLAVDYGCLDSHLLYRHRLTDPEDVKAVLGSQVLVIMRASHPREVSTCEWALPPAVPRRTGYQLVPIQLTLDYDISLISQAAKRSFYEGKFPCHCPVPCGDDCPSKLRRRFCGPYNCLHPDCPNVLDRGDLPCGEVYATQDMGYGLRAKTAIYPDRFITGFTGHLLAISADGLSGPSETVFQQSNSVVLLRSTLTHLFVVACGEFQDRHGRLGQYANHSCSPNCRLEVWADEFGVPTAWIISNTLIDIGEAFTINYNQVVSDPSELQQCLCGMPGDHYMQKLCRGVTFPGKIVSTNGARDKEIINQEARSFAGPAMAISSVTVAVPVLAQAIAIRVAGPGVVVEVPPLPDPSLYPPRSA